MYLIYSLLFTIGVILSAPYYLWRYRGRGLSRSYWRERFGFLPESFQLRAGASAGGGGSIWVHAVSLGETLAVVGLVREILGRYPGRRVFLSSVTPAGRQAGEARLPNLAGHFYLPLDWGWAVRRVFRRLRPAMLVIVETELWPNLLRVAHESGTQVFIANARLSDNSFRGYRLFRPFVRGVLQSVDGVFAQTARDAERFRQLGCGPERVWVAGNLKFDGSPPQLGALPQRLRKALKEAGRGPVIVAASTMPGEEELLLPAWEEIRSQHPAALLVLAPRHPARFDDVAQMLARSERSFVRRTALETAEEELAAQLRSPEILLLNTIGELAGVFQLADLVFVGGSLVPTGGHNLLEPAFWSKAILFGPHMQNFRDAAALFLAERAALQVQKPSELRRQALALLEKAELRSEMGARAKQVLKKHSGATSRILDRLFEILDAESPEPTRVPADLRADSSGGETR